MLQEIITCKEACQLPTHTNARVPTQFHTESFNFMGAGHIAEVRRTQLHNFMLNKH